jgi:hypothetical protein
MISVDRQPEYHLLASIEEIFPQQQNNPLLWLLATSFFTNLN